MSQVHKFAEDFEVKSDLVDDLDRDGEDLDFTDPETDCMLPEYREAMRLLSQFY